LDSAQEAKQAAARRALELVRAGMVLGLGTGSTASYFIRGLGDLVRGGLKVSAVPTSLASADAARRLGIDVLLEFDGTIDLAVDGADEIDPHLNLIKGRGGALLREKMVAASAERFVVIADRSKLVSRLGQGVLPVEVLPFLWSRTARRLSDLGAEWTLRGGEASPYLTDNGNLILDLRLGPGVADAVDLGREINNIVGVIENGIFSGLASACILADESGVEIMGTLA